MKENFWPIVIATVLGFMFSLGYLFIEQQGYFAPANNESANIAVTSAQLLQVAGVSRDPGGITAPANNESANIAVTSAQPLQVADVSRDPGGITQAPPPNLGFDIKYVYRRKTESNFNTLTDNTVLHSGDYYKIIFTPAEKTYADRTRTAQAVLTKSIKSRDPGGIESSSTQTETFTVLDNHGKQSTMIRDRLKSCDGCRSEVTFQHE